MSVLRKLALDTCLRHGFHPFHGRLGFLEEHSHSPKQWKSGLDRPLVQAQFYLSKSVRQEILSKSVIVN